jgi:hypothetical protein
MPASAWPGTEQMNVNPPVGTVTLPVAVLPPSALTLVPSAKVRSCSTPPSLTNFTSYSPAAATATSAGLKPRSKACTSMVPIGPAATELPGLRLAEEPLAGPGPTMTAASSRTPAKSAPMPVKAAK